MPKKNYKLRELTLTPICNAPNLLGQLEGEEKIILGTIFTLHRDTIC